jgi:hypothetical protein
MIPIGAFKQPEEYDPYWSQVILRCPFNTYTADVSTSQNATGTVGSPSIVTSGQKYGAGALSVAVADSVNYNAMPAIGTGDYVFEGWFYSTKALTLNSLVLAVGEIRTNSSSTAGFILYHNATFRLKIYQGGTTKLTATADLKKDDWTHLAVQRVSGTTSLFVDGISTGTPFSDSGNYTAGVTVGGPTLYGLEAMAGIIDDLRVTTRSRYSSPFTPNSSELPAR